MMTMLLLHDAHGLGIDIAAQRNQLAGEIVAVLLPDLLIIQRDAITELFSSRNLSDLMQLGEH